MTDSQEWLAKMRADADQAKEGLKEMGGAIGVLYKELVEQGLPLESATFIAGQWLVTMMQLAHSSFEEEEGSS